MLCAPVTWVTVLLTLNLPCLANVSSPWLDNTDISCPEPPPGSDFLSFLNLCSRLLESSGKMGQVDQKWGAEYEHFYFGRLKNYKITHLPPHFTMFKSINRVLLCLIQLLTEGVNLSVSQIFAMKLRFPLRQAGVDSDLVQNIWVIIWWVGARGPTRLGISEFTQIFWVFPVYVAHFWQTFWVNWQNGSNWSNLRLRISVSALERLKNHNIPHLRPNFTMFTK